METSNSGQEAARADLPETHSESPVPVLTQEAQASVFPVPPDQAPYPGQTKRSSEPDSRITVVICDDHPAYAQGLALLLERESPGFQVLGTATNAAQAISLVPSLNPQVVLMDIRMPITDGIEATRQIKAASKDTKVIMLTVSDEAGDLYEAMRAGASGFVTKDREVAEIAEAVSSVIRGHLTIPSDLSARFLQDVTNADITHSLTEIETVLLNGFTQGKTNKQIAQTLGKSERTVCRRIDDLYRKLNITDRIQAAIWATQQGFGTPNRNGTERKPGRPLKVPRKPGRQLGSNGIRKTGRPLKVRGENRPQRPLVAAEVQIPTQTPTQEETAT